MLTGVIILEMFMMLSGVAILWLALLVYHRRGPDEPMFASRELLIWHVEVLLVAAVVMLFGFFTYILSTVFQIALLLDVTQFTAVLYAGAILYLLLNQVRYDAL